jgi:hypothetical protein
LFHSCWGSSLLQVAAITCLPPPYAGEAISRQCPVSVFFRVWPAAVELPMRHTT